MGRRTFTSRVKRVLLKTAETKHLDLAIENNQLFHNLGYGTTGVPPVNVTSIPFFFNPWSKIQQGVARNMRVGDKITPRGMSLKLYIANKTDRPNTMVRVIIAILPKEVNGTVTTNVFDPFQVQNSGTCGNNMLFSADQDVGVKFLYDKIHRINLGQATGVSGLLNLKESTKVIKLWIKRKTSRDIVYSNALSVITNKPLAVYVLPYEQYSTLTTDNVASVAGFMRLYFKDV